MPPRNVKQKNRRLAIILAGVFAALSVGSVIFIAIWH